MHSRIFEISKEPIAPDDRMNEHSIPDWFCKTNADYVSDETNRETDIEWFFEDTANVFKRLDDGDSFTVLPDGRVKYFAGKYAAFFQKAKALASITLEEFAGEKKSNADMDLYVLNEAYVDEHSFYVYYKEELIPLDEWIREYDLDGSFFIGGTVDYHF